jgi:RNA polymerase sigma-70 factor, ECF subfamily
MNETPACNDPTEPTDPDARLAALWQRAQAGDEAAYRLALLALAARLRGYFGRRLFGLPDAVEDLVQETLLALHLQRGTHDPRLPLLAWVHAIARHKWVDALRRHGRREALHEPLDELPDALHPVVADEQPARHDVAKLLARLPEAQRQAILRTKLEGLTVAEAARLGGVSEVALKVSVHRGLKKLAAWMRGDA